MSEECEHEWERQIWGGSVVIACKKCGILKGAEE